MTDAIRGLVRYEPHPGEEIPRLLKRSNRLNRLARYIAAKYLGEGT